MTFEDLETSVHKNSPITPCNTLKMIGDPYESSYSMLQNLEYGYTQNTSIDSCLLKRRGEERQLRDSSTCNARECRDARHWKMNFSLEPSTARTPLQRNNSKPNFHIKELFHTSNSLTFNSRPSKVRADDGHNRLNGAEVGSSTMPATFAVPLDM